MKETTLWLIMDIKILFLYSTLRYLLKLLTTSIHFQLYIFSYTFSTIHFQLYIFSITFSVLHFQCYILTDTFSLIHFHWYIFTDTFSVLLLVEETKTIKSKIYFIQSCFWLLCVNYYFSLFFLLFKKLSFKNR